MADKESSRKSSGKPSGKPRARPLSPHLSVYKPQITSVLSITHRATGVFLLLGAFILVWWLTALAAGEQGCTCVFTLLSSGTGKLFLLGWTLSLFYHLANGIRHLFWDIGYGFELKTVTVSGVAALVFAVLATLIAWKMAGGF